VEYFFTLKLEADPAAADPHRNPWGLSEQDLAHMWVQITVGDTTFAPEEIWYRQPV
jgi:hypothetical protein